MNPLLMLAVLVYTLDPFARKIRTKWNALSQMAPENRTDQPKARLLRLLRLGFKQERLLSKPRELVSGSMHALIFWAALTIGLREFIVIGEGFVHGFQEYLPFLGSSSIIAYGYTTLYNIAEFIVFCMVLYALYRRLVLKPKRLDLNWEGIYVLLFIFGIVVSDLIFDAGRFNLIQVWNHDLHYLSSPDYGVEMNWAPVASALAFLLSGFGENTQLFFYHVGFWSHSIIMLTFLNMLVNTKQFHEITAIPNIYLSSLDTPHAPVALMDLEDEDAWDSGKIGVNRLEHLTWKQGLDLYSCTECGRCHDVCPTYVSNKPLTQKWVNQSLLKHLRAEESHLAKHGTTHKDTALVGSIIAPETLWACTTCRACEEACPVAIEHVPRMIAMRQGQVLMEDNYPDELASAYKGLERNGNPWGIGYDKRAKWAEGLDVQLMSEVNTEDLEILLWVGCSGAFDAKSQKITVAVTRLLQKAKVRFAILGTEEKCTGDFARRTGNEMLYQMMAQENIETLDNYKVKQIVTLCPHCLNTLKNEYPQLGGNYEVQHHSQYLMYLVQTGRLELPKNSELSATFHDPCYLGRYNKEYDAPRQLFNKVSKIPLKEMSRNRKESFCCGAGGGRMWMEESIGERINEERSNEALKTNADTLITACPFCMTMLNDGVAATGNEEQLKIQDIAEVLLKCIEDA